MTSGQGEQPGGPYGPPQGWNAPPAPSGHGAPQAMERPVTVRAGLGAFIGSTVLNVVAQVVTLLNWDTIVQWTLAKLGVSGADLDAALESAEANVRLSTVTGLIFVAAYAVFLWFAWRGHNWGRIVLWVFAGLGIAGAMVNFAVGSPLGFLTALNVFQLLLLIAAVVLLAMKPSNEWYRFRRWQRATGQG
jgi:hypothetical protein